MIDLENNAISDLSPLSINYLESLGSAEELTDIDEGKKWFGEQLRNTHLNISLNPVRKISGNSRRAFDHKANARPGV